MIPLAIAARFFLAILFLQAGVAKLTAVQDFRETVANYQLLPPLMVSTVVGGCLP